MVNAANFVLLDAARMLDRMDKARELNPKHICLYRGKSEEVLRQVAPYLFSYEQESPFAQWLEEGWADAWGVFLSSRKNMDDLLKHFRQFLMVKTEDGEELYFRFYDPRVLRIFLPTCDNKQLSSLFSGIEKYIVESETGEEQLYYSYDGRDLITEKHPYILKPKLVEEDTETASDEILEHPVPIAESNNIENPPTVHTIPNPEAPTTGLGFSFD